MAIDLVTLQILANHCGAATESMAQTLFRTAHSTFVKETEDFTTGLATPDGKTFASPYDLGATSARLSRANVEVHQGGFRVPPVKLYKRGELNREVLDRMLLNVRMREK